MIETRDPGPAPVAASPRVPASSSHRERRLFLFGILLEILFTAWLALSHRIPGGNDGFQYCLMQYILLNDSVLLGEIPRWFPFFMHGNPASYTYVIAVSPGLQLMLMAGRFLSGAGFLSLFHAGVLLQSLILYFGTWLMGRRLGYRPETRFFVSIAAVHSTVWTLQPWFGLTFFATLPLVLEAYHRFLESGRWRWFFAANHLVIWQALGNLQYFLPAVSAVAFLYFASWAASHPREALAALRRPRWNVAALAAVAGSAAGLAVLYLFLKLGNEPVVNYSWGREQGGILSLDQFLHGLGTLPPGQILELVLPAPSRADLSLYSGILPLALLLPAFFSRRIREWRHVHFTVAAVLLLAFGSPLANLFYHAWPMMSYYRPLIALLPFARLFLCLAAGAGLETILDELPAVRRFVGVIGRFFLYGGILVAASAGISSGPAAIYILMNYQIPGTQSLLPLRYAMADPGVMATHLFASSVVWILSGALLLAVSGRILARHARWFPLAILFALVLDLGAHRARMLRLDTVALGPEARKAFEWRPLLFPAERPATHRADDGASAVLDSLTPPAHRHLFGITNSFLMADERDCVYRSDYWLEPLDKLLRAAHGRAFDDTIELAPGKKQPYSGVYWPRRPLVDRLTGVHGKIQLFSGGRVYASDDSAAEALRPWDRDTFVLVLSSSASLPTAESTPEAHWMPHADTPLSFSSNHLTLDVENPAPAPAWMVYCDVWHPGWTARIDGRPVAVERANLAYKAVLVPTGRHRVEFRFDPPGLKEFQHLFLLNNLLVLLFLGAWCLRSFRDPEIAPRTVTAP